MSDDTMLAEVRAAPLVAIVTEVAQQLSTVQTVQFLDHLQKKNSEEVAFYPRVALERGVEGGLVTVAWERGQPAGYLYRSRPVPGGTVRIWQAVIEYDLRRNRFGTAMVQDLILNATTAGALAIQLRCRSSIEANVFWKTMGLYCIAVTPGGVRRDADINTWRMDLQPSFFSQPKEPSTKASSSAKWLTQRKTVLAMERES